MKELVLKKRLELEDVCRNAHMEPDMNTAPEKIIALIDSGMCSDTKLELADGQFFNNLRTFHIQV